ncbi:LuxR C-terminal-related transcriptional regulator [Streptomyces pseudogriseolus]|uniref:LuxR C-terminal-related transcriptional regulator n=1 Tax=Streptomyces pseudogriseolus TaxID=36817 RepID=UPI003FA2CE00
MRESTPGEALAQARNTVELAWLIAAFAAGGGRPYGGPSGGRTKPSAPVRRPHAAGPTRRIAADPAPAGAHVVMPTNYGMDEYVFEALRAGASGSLVKDILPKGFLPKDFPHSVRVAAGGDALLAPDITRRLTDRERETVALAAHGLSNDEMARRLVISPATAKTHINRAMTKLHARDRAQLVVLVYESGLVTPRNA